MRASSQVIDEIDGALGEGKGAVDVILKMVSFNCFCFLISHDFDIDFEHPKVSFLDNYTHLIHQYL